VKEKGSMNSKVISFTLKLLCLQRKSGRFKNDIKLGRTHSQFGPSGEQKKSCPCSKSIPDCTVHMQSLYWLSYPG
jgi:hypothetical protein